MHHGRRLGRNCGGKMQHKMLAPHRAARHDTRALQQTLHLLLSSLCDCLQQRRCCLCMCLPRRMSHANSSTDAGGTLSHRVATQMKPAMPRTAAKLMCIVCPGFKLKSLRPACCCCCWPGSAPVPPLLPSLPAMLPAAAAAPAGCDASSCENSCRSCSASCLRLRYCRYSSRAAAKSEASPRPLMA